MTNFAAGVGALADVLIPSDTVACARYVGLIIGAHVGVYTGIRTVIDPFYVEDWEHALALRHRQLFDTLMSDDVQQVVTVALNAVSGLKHPKYQQIYGDEGTFWSAYDAAHQHTHAVMTDLVARYGTGLVADVSFASAVPRVADALNHAARLANAVASVPPQKKSSDWPEGHVLGCGARRRYRHAARPRISVTTGVDLTPVEAGRRAINSRNYYPMSFQKQKRPGGPGFPALARWRAS